MLQKELIFSEDQTIANAGVEVSTNIIQYPTLEDAFGNELKPRTGESGNLYLVSKLQTDGPPAILKVIWATYTSTDIQNGTQHFEIFFPADAEAGSKRVIALSAEDFDTYQGVLYFSGNVTSFDISTYLTLEYETPTT